MPLIDEASDMTPEKMDYAARRIAEGRPMLTDEQIRELRDSPIIKEGWAKHLTELCARVLEAEAEAETLRRNNEVLRADLLDVMRSRDTDIARVKVLEDALKAAADSMTCKPYGHNAAHYCPNCDNNMYGPRDAARKALEAGK